MTGDGVTVTDPQAWPPFKFKLVAACEPPQQVDGLTRAGWRAGAPGSGGCRGRRGGFRGGVSSSESESVLVKVTVTGFNLSWMIWMPRHATVTLSVPQLALAACRRVSGSLTVTVAAIWKPIPVHKPPSLCHIPWI